MPRQDQLRLKLRDIRRRISGTHGPATTTADDLPTLPGVQSLAIATRYIDGGRGRFIDYVQMAVLNRIECAEKWWHVYAELSPNERAIVSFDDVCAASGVRPAELMANVVAVSMEYGHDVGELVAASMHPAIVHQAVKSAKRIGGDYAHIAVKDREMLFQHQKFVPIPKTAIVHVNATANANGLAAASAVPMGAAHAPFASTMHGLSDVRSEVHRRLLAPAAADLEPIDAVPVREPASLPPDDAG